MIRFVIVKPEGNGDVGPAFWSQKAYGWVHTINLATRYKKRDEADRIAFKMVVSNGSLHEIAVDQASKYEGEIRWKLWFPKDLCPDCARADGVRDVYMCSKTCLGHRPMKHRHGTCRACGFAALLLPVVRLTR